MDLRSLMLAAEVRSRLLLRVLGELGWIELALHPDL